MTQQKKESWRGRNKPVIYAIVLAIVMTMFISPEVMNDNSMAPAIDNGNLILVTNSSYSAKRGAPELGRVVVMEKNYAKDVSKDNIVSRVCGLPGEKIEIKNEKFYRNGKEYKVKGATGNLGKDMTVKVDKDHVFLLSDNRDSKIDSRNKKMGPVNMRKIKGNAKYILWPFSSFGRID